MSQLPLTPTILPISRKNFLSARVLSWQSEEVIADKPGVVVIGVNDNRFYQTDGLTSAPTLIRKQLYELADFISDLPLYDAGDIINGESLEETYNKLADVIRFFAKKGHVVLILGGGSDILAAQYNFTTDKIIAGQMVVIDSKICPQHNYEDQEPMFSKHLRNNQSDLFKFTNIGYQAHYCAYSTVKTYEDMGYELIKLSQARTNIEELEPHFRDAETAAISLNAVRHCDAPASLFPSPSGFTGEEICQLSCYAGLSTNIKAFGIYDLNTTSQNDITIQQAAQIAWYFIEGVYNRIYEDPTDDSPTIKKYIIPIDGSSIDIIFYRSLLSDRWWLEIPATSKNKPARLVACTLADYEKACKKEFPDRWINQR